jgi:hypothetical protein
MPRTIAPVSRFNSGEPERQIYNGVISGPGSVVPVNNIISGGISQLSQTSIHVPLNLNLEFKKSIINLCSKLSINNKDNTSIINAGSLTIDGQSLGNYEYIVKKTDTDINSFTSSDWFSATENSVSSFLIFNKNLSIPSGVTFTPSGKKLFTVIYVKGDLYLNGTISMTGKGANHSPAGSPLSASAISIFYGIKSSIVNGNVPATGGSGGSPASIGTPGVSSVGGTGTSGSSGGTGGGGGGGKSFWTDGSNGQPGTSFAGGPGGGGGADYNPATEQKGYTPGNPFPAPVIPQLAVGQGGKGSNGLGGIGAYNTAPGNSGGGGGAGNPGGPAPVAIYDGVTGTPGGTGVGGVLILIVLGSIFGSGTISANGVSGGAGGVTPEPYCGGGGGGSGGGSVTVICDNVSSSITVQSNGGSGGASTNPSRGGTGGSGGAGTARVLKLI